jgi:hypothetical protein
LQARTFRNTIHEPKPRHPLNTIDYIRLNSHLIIENTIIYRLPNHPHKSKPNDQKTFPPFFISTITKLKMFNATSTAISKHHNPTNRVH